MADELWNLTGHNYYFVELANLQAEHRKGDSYDYSDRPYLLRAWQSKRITVKQWSWHRRQNVVCSQEYRLCLSKDTNEARAAVIRYERAMAETGSFELIFTCYLENVPRLSFRRLE